MVLSQRAREITEREQIVKLTGQVIGSAFRCAYARGVVRVPRSSYRCVCGGLKYNPQTQTFSTTPRLPATISLIHSLSLSPSLSYYTHTNLRTSVIFRINDKYLLLLKNNRVKLSLDIPEKIYDQLSKLSETYSQDVEKTVNEILDGVCFDIHWLLEAKKKDPNTLGFRYKISSRLDSGKWADNILFDKILKEFKAEGHFVTSDMEIDLDDNSIWINYQGLMGSNLLVDSFDIFITGLKRLETECTVEVDEDDDETMWKVEEHANRIRSILDELPEGFRELDHWEVSVSSEDVTSFCLKADFVEESVSYLPSIPAISEFFEKVLKSAGVTKHLSE